MRGYSSVESSLHKFAQDVGREKRNVPKLSFYDGHLYSAVAAGHVSGKTNHVPVIVNADYSKYIVSRGNMNQVIRSDKPRVDSVNMQKVDCGDKNRSE